MKIIFIDYIKEKAIIYSLLKGFLYYERKLKLRINRLHPAFLVCSLSWFITEKSKEHFVKSAPLINNMVK